MSEEIAPLGEDAFVGLRLIQLYAFTADLLATPHTGREPKRAAVAELLASSQEAARAAAEGSPLRRFLPLEGDPPSLDAIRDAAAGLPLQSGSSASTAVLIEIATSTRWFKGVSWASDRDDTVAAAADVVLSGVTRSEVADLRSLHNAAAKRLRKDSVSPGAQVTLGAAMAAFGVASGGISNAVGTFVGTHFLGLSGAAATSAGLAMLGGGSLATGGFGMAGGTLLIGQASHLGGKRLAVLLATASSAAVIDELAKIDVRISKTPGTMRSTVQALEALRGDLQADLDEMGAGEDRRERVRTAGRLAVDVTLLRPGKVAEEAKAFLNQRADAEEKNLRASLRAVDFEIRWLEAPTWKRRAMWVSRTTMTPGLSLVAEAAANRLRQRREGPTADVD